MAKIKLTVIKDLDGVERVLEDMITVNKALFKVGTLSKAELVKNWSKGKGGNNAAWQGEFLENPASELSPTYELFKASKGKTPIPNMSFTGQMQRALTPTKLGGENTVSLRFLGENDKAAGNHDKRPNMFILSKKFKDKMVKAVRKFIFPF